MCNILVQELAVSSHEENLKKEGKDLLLHDANCLLTTAHLFLTRQQTMSDRLCGLVVRVPGYGSRGTGSISGTTRFIEK
jgi:hypothetical protein